ncbi:hypothetical protein C8Q77DRAFT_150096 [Trametes polyzona]|nr:hypothetical protein C8Q77DRAFT_150096 [Trametes polyzona]
MLITERCLGIDSRCIFIALPLSFRINPEATECARFEGICASRYVHTPLRRSTLHKGAPQCCPPQLALCAFSGISGNQPTPAATSSLSSASLYVSLSIPASRAASRRAPQISLRDRGSHLSSHRTHPPAAERTPLDERFLPSRGAHRAHSLSPSSPGPRIEGPGEHNEAARMAHPGHLRRRDCMQEPREGGGGPSPPARHRGREARGRSCQRAQTAGVPRHTP